MLPDRVSNPGPLTYESGALSIALRGPASFMVRYRKYLTYSSDTPVYLCLDKVVQNIMEVY